MYISTSAFGLVAALAAPASAFFRMSCPGRILDERADPIVSPGAVSGHVHTISGGNGFGFNMDYNQARASTCSSCAIKEDLSNYWTPKLYYQYANGSFQDVPQIGDGTGVLGGMTVYYLQRPGPNKDTLKAFPKGFRMLAGNPFKRSATDDLASKAVSFVCLDYSSSSPQTAGMPTKNCPNGLRAQIFFPSCWDGVNLDSPDHKSHMAYPEGSSYDNGKCPSTHPVHMVSLFYEVLYRTSDFADKWHGSGQPFVFAQGDPTGYGFHGDFVNGWDIDVLQKAVDTCTSDSGLLSDCSAFSLFSTKESQACIVPPSIDEPIHGVLDKLPGCNTVTSGPGLAPIPSSCPVPAIGSFKQYFTDVTGSLGYQYEGCATDVYSSRTINAASQNLGSMTVESCVTYCSGKGYTYAGLEYASECYCGNSVASDRAPKAGVLGNCFTPCAGNSAETCGGGGALSLYKKCASGSCVNSVYKGPGGSVAAVVASPAASSSSAASKAATTSSSSRASSATTISTSTKTSTTTKASTTSTKTSSSSAKASTTVAAPKRKQKWSARQRARFAAARAAHLEAEKQEGEVKAALAA